MFKTREYEIVVEGEVMLHSSTVNLEAVLERLGVNPTLLSESFVVLEGGLYKLVVPGETEEDEALIVLTLPENQLKRTQGLETKLRKEAEKAGYEAEAVEVVVASATRLMSEAYINGKRAADDHKGNDVFPREKGRVRGGLIENVQMTAARPLTIFTQRGWQAVKDISNENFERGVLDAMLANDITRMNYLITQAAKALEVSGSMRIDVGWRRLYEDSMALEVGAGNYPSVDTVPGFRMFMEKVYLPYVAILLAGAEIASTMGDHKAVMATAELKSQMEVELAQKAANTAEKVQPARARMEVARINAEAGIAGELEKCGDVLKEGKRVSAQLAAATVASPLLNGAGQVIEAGFEVIPSVFKGYAQAWDRWLESRGVDPKLVSYTAFGGVAGLVGGAVGLLVAGPLVGLVILTVPALGAPMIYEGIKGLKK